MVLKVKSNDKWSWKILPVNGVERFQLINGLEKITNGLERIHMINGVERMQWTWKRSNDEWFWKDPMVLKEFNGLERS